MISVITFWQLLSDVYDLATWALRRVRGVTSRLGQYLARQMLRALRVERSEAEITCSTNCSRDVAESLKAEFESAGWRVNIPTVPLGDGYPYVRGIQIRGWSPQLVDRMKIVVTRLTGQNVAIELIDGSTMHEDNPKWAFRDSRVYICVGYLHAAQ